MIPSQTQRKQTLEENLRVGKFSEETAKAEYVADGWEIFPTFIGYDFLAVKKLSDGEELVEYVEVKSGGARLSKLQTLMMRRCKREGKTYRVFRVNPNYIQSHLNTKTNTLSTLETNEHLQIPETTSCPNCKKTASDIFEIMKKFGLRKIRGKIIVQSWCRGCRFPYGGISS